MHHIYFKKLTYFLFWVIGGSDFRFHLMFWFMCLYQHEHLLLMEQLRLLFFLAVSQLCILSVSSRGSETFNNLSSCLGATMAALLLSKSTKTNPIVKFLYIRISRVFFFLHWTTTFLCRHAKWSENAIILVRLHIWIHIYTHAQTCTWDTQPTPSFCL